MENYPIFKNPSSKDIIFIEDIIQKYHLEDIYLNYLEEDDQEMIRKAEDSSQRAAFKSLFEDVFPYTRILWDIVYLFINQKISSSELPEKIKTLTKLSPELCEAISQEIMNNETVQKEIVAIRIEEDMPYSEKDFEDEHSRINEQEIADEKTLRRFEEEIEENNGHKDTPKKGGGLGQELA